MKKYILISMILLLIGIISIFYCLNKQQELYQIVKFKGGQEYYNFSKSYYTWIVGNNKDSLSALPLCHKDFVVIEFDNELNNEKAFIYQYLKYDGNNLEFSIQNFKFLLNNKIISIIIKENDELINWLENVNAKELENLRSIIITDEFSSDYLYLLKKISTIKPNIGIFVEEEIEDIHEILEIIDPTWLVAPNCDFNAKTVESISNLNNIELLYIDCNFLDINKLSKLPKLSGLIISDLDQPLEDNFLNSTEQVSSLSIIGSKIKNTTFLNKLTNLTELNLIECDSLIDISNIDKLNKIKVVNLTGCDNLSEISKIKQLPSLFWFSFPNNINQNDFEAFIEADNNIEIIELVGCKNIQNINSLKKLDDLSCLHIYDMDIDRNSLYDLKELKYLSISEEVLSDTTEIFDGKNKMPNTIIVPSIGFCLGSGWLLLFIPILLITKISLFFFKRIKKQI